MKSLKRARTSVDLQPETYEELMAEVQCFSCKGIPGPGPGPWNSYRCLDNCHSLCLDCSYPIDFEEADDKRGICPCGSKIRPNPCNMTQILVRMKIIPWFCCHYANGCREVFQEESALSDHQDECIYRNLKCCDPVCDKEVLFKDFLDHYSACRPEELRVFNTEKITVSYFARLCAANENMSYFPDRIEAHGSTFFFVCRVDNDYYRMWMLMHSSSDDALKNYEWRLQVKSGDDEEFVFRGKPFSTDRHYEHVIEKQDGFAIGIKKAVEIQERLGNIFEVEIEIRNLKEEVKDKDMESGVSSDECD